MEISLALILDELALETDSYNPGGSNPKFKSVRLYIPGEQLVPDGRLLVCTLAEAVAADKSDGMYFLCNRDGPVNPQVGERDLRGISAVRSDITMRELFNRISGVFEKYSKWILSLEKSVVRRKGLQDLLDLSEPIFGNFISIQDSTFKLVAHTKNINAPVGITSSLLQLGYHPPENMALLSKHRRIEEYKTSTEILISFDKVTSEFDVVKRTFHLGGSIYYMVVMECNARPANNSTVELFSILTHYIKEYADHDIAQRGGIGGVIALVVDILNRNVESKEEARIRSTYCEYPFGGGFRLYLFSFEDEDNVPLASVVNDLTVSCKDVVALAYNNYALMIEHKKEDIVLTCQNAADTLDKTGFVCGISNDFDTLWNLPAALEQAVIAIDISSRLKASAIDGHSKFRMFSDYITYHLIGAGFKSAPDAYRNSFFTDSIEKIRKYDEYHKTETAKILRLFLENDRSATATSSIIHMHRNTVLYHMEKISAFLGVSFDDPEERFKLLLAFRASDFENL